MINARWVLLLLTVPTLLGCRSTPGGLPMRYLVTERVIDVGVAPGLCVAVDVNDVAGVWWWQPGLAGCGSRSTGPELMHPSDAAVTRSSQSGVFEVSFRLGTHSPTRPFVDVRLVVENGTMRVAGAKDGVPLLPRSDLEIPEMVGVGTAGEHHD